MIKCFPLSDGKFKAPPRANPDVIPNMRRKNKKGMKNFSMLGFVFIIIRFLCFVAFFRIVS